jgi:hypothetical protein
VAECVRSGPNNKIGVIVTGGVLKTHIVVERVKK